MIKGHVSVEMIPVHKISIVTKTKSKARILWKIKTSKILVGERYDLWLKLRNVGAEGFPGGRAKISIVYKSKQGQTIEFPVDPIEKDKETHFVGPFSNDAMDSGYVNFLAEIRANDGKPVRLIRDGQVLPPNATFHDVLIKTHADVYGIWILLGTLVSIFLGILALLK